MGTISEIDTMFTMEEEINSRINNKSDGRAIIKNGIPPETDLYMNGGSPGLEIRRLDEEYRRRASRVSCKCYARFSRFSSPIMFSSYLPLNMVIFATLCHCKGKLVFHFCLVLFHYWFMFFIPFSVSWNFKCK
jgi:hypothetical protein